MLCFAAPLLVLQLYREAIPKFQQFLLAAMDPELRAGLMALQVRGLKLAACGCMLQLECCQRCLCHPAQLSC